MPFTSRLKRPVAAAIGIFPKRLKVVSVRVDGTKMTIMLDSGAIHNVLNASVASRLSLSPEKTSTMITIANGQKKSCLGAIENMPVFFNGRITSLDLFST